jgi:hypothetical protein
MADDEEGVALGRHYDEATQRAGSKIVYAGERHLLLFGPNGTGKGTRFLIPNLLSIKDRSIIVIDPKGELAAVTAEYRRTVSDVVILNPFNVLGFGSAGFNPLAALDPKSPNFYDDAAALGEALIKIEGKEPHWSESAQGLLVALLMWDKIKNGERANLENVRALLTEPDTWERYTGEDGKQRQRPKGGLSVTAADMVEYGDEENAGGYEIASLAARFTETDKRNRQHPLDRRHANPLDLVKAHARRSAQVGRGFFEAERQADDGLCDPARRTHAHSFGMVAPRDCVGAPRALSTRWLAHAVPNRRDASARSSRPARRRLRPCARVSGANRGNLPRPRATEGALQGAKLTIKTSFLILNLIWVSTQEKSLFRFAIIRSIISSLSPPAHSETSCLAPTHTPNSKPSVKSNSNSSRKSKTQKPKPKKTNGKKINTAISSPVPSP